MSFQRQLPRAVRKLAQRPGSFWVCRGSLGRFGGPKAARICRFRRHCVRRIERRAQLEMPRHQTIFSPMQQPNYTRPAGRSVIAASIVVLISGCGIREPSIVDRCADILRAAWPGRALEVTSKKAAPDFTNNLATVAVAVQAKATGTSGSPRELGIECTFENSVVTGIRWTAGVP